ncbi:MAG: hypothetical protein ABI135_04275 [Rhodoferax sp.]
MLGRDSIAIRESQAHGLVIADRVSLPCMLSFVSLESRVTEPMVASAWAALDKVRRCGRPLARAAAPSGD